MRDIEFRIWDGKKYIYSGSSCNEDNTLDLFFCGYGLPWAEIDQYIGLEDKNGRRIFENDFVKLKTIDATVLGKITYVAPFFCVSNDNDDWDIDEFFSIEVVDNNRGEI